MSHGQHHHHNRAEQVFSKMHINTSSFYLTLAAPLIAGQPATSVTALHRKHTLPTPHSPSSTTPLSPCGCGSHITNA